MEDYKIVFIDIDGTLANSKKQVSEENKKCLKTLTDSGVKVVLTSARPYVSVADFACECSLQDIHIASNGAVCVNTKTDEILFKKAIDKNSSIEILSLAIKHNIHFMATINGYQHVPSKKWGICPKSRPDVVVTEDVISLLKNNNLNVLKVVFLDESKEKLIKFKKELERFSGIKIMPIEVMCIPDEIRNQDGVCNNPFNLDIMAEEISKSKGIETALKYFGIKKEQSIGIGDGLNDLDLFEGVGLKIAMKNANDGLKQKADIITDYDNNNSGVGKTLSKIFSIKI